MKKVEPIIVAVIFMIMGVVAIVGYAVAERIGARTETETIEPWCTPGMLDVANDDECWRVITDGTRYKVQFRIGRDDPWQHVSDVTHPTIEKAQYVITKSRDTLRNDAAVQWTEVTP